ncbi:MULTISPECIES: hypothetical protein [Pirellulaceae]|uniref:hypothetical protein n=1 Tax=Pirellulaceae TaxID=2691357 RepID=UPI0018EC982C
MIVAGFLTRFSALPKITIMVVAIDTTKRPIIWVDGFWEMADAASTDFCTLLGSIYLLFGGSRPRIIRLATCASETNVVAQHFSSLKFEPS